MKRVLSLVLALVMVLGTVLPVFAEEVTTAGEQLEAYGLITGTDEGLAEDQPLLRAEMAVILAKLNGKAEEAAAYAFPSGFSDLEADAWYIPWVAYAEAQGWMNGDGTTFRPMDNLSAQEVNILMVEALGYTVEWDMANAKAEELGVAVTAADKTLVLRGEIFTNMVTTLDVMPMDSEMTLGSKLALAGYEAPVAPTPETLEVVSVEALNLKEIQVTFNKAVDVDRTNILVAGSKVLAKYFDLSEDKTVVTLFNNNATQTGQTVKVVVTGIEDYTTTHHEVTLNDAALPVVEKVETVGNTLVKVYFSEPMNSGLTLSNFKIDGKVKSAAVSISDNKKIVNLTLATALADGEYKLAVNAVNVKDFAGNVIANNETEFAVAEYAATPEWSVLEATQESVKIQFEREPKSADYIYWEDGSTTKKSSTKVIDTDPTIYTFGFTSTNRLPSGEVSVKLNKLTDYSKNVTEDKAFTVTATIDTVRPEFESVTQYDSTTFYVQYTKDVDLNTSAVYTLTDSEGIVKTGTDTYKDSTDKSLVSVAFTGLRTDRNPYTLTIKGVEDTTYLDNRISDVVMEISVNDSDAPTLLSLNKNGNIVSLVFNEDVDGVMLENFKYKVGTSFYALPDAAYITAVNAKAYNITFPADFGPADAHHVSSIIDWYTSDVMDLAGNKILAVVNGAGPVGAIADFAIHATDSVIYVVDANTILLRPAKTLVDVWEGDFKVMAGTTELTVTAAELITTDSDVNKYDLPGTGATGVGNPLALPSTDTTVQLVQLTIDEDLNADSTYGGTNIAIDVASQLAADVAITTDALGNKLVFTSTPVADRIIPAAPTAGNFTVVEGTKTLDLSTSFVTDEPVLVDVGVFADATTTTTQFDSTPSDNDEISSRDSFDANDVTIADITVTGLDVDESVYVRFEDATGNYSAWVKVGDVSPVDPTSAAIVVNNIDAGTDDATDKDTVVLVADNGGSEWASTGLVDGDTIAITSGTETMTYTLQTGDMAKISGAGATDITITIGTTTTGVAYTGTVATAAGFDAAVVNTADTLTIVLTDAEADTTTSAVNDPTAD